MKKEKPEITIMREDKKGVVEFGAKKKVMKCGDSGHIVLPNKLVGKIVEVYYLHPEYKEDKNEHKRTKAKKVCRKI